MGPRGRGRGRVVGWAGERGRGSLIVSVVGEGAAADTTGVVLVQASARGAWRGAVLPGTAGLVFSGVGIGVASSGLILGGLGFALVAALRAVWWARVGSTSRLLDRDGALVWMYRGELRDAVPWSDLRHVLFQRWARRVLWSLGPQSGGPFPFLLIDSRADRRPPGFRHFAEVMIIDEAELETADRALAAACRRHRVTYHGIESNW